MRTFEAPSLWGSVRAGAQEWRNEHLYEERLPRVLRGCSQKLENLTFELALTLPGRPTLTLHDAGGESTFGRKQARASSVKR
jgi:hypothetical protein